jgi:iron complex outermembrane receptor protein
MRLIGEMNMRATAVLLAGVSLIASTTPGWARTTNESVGTQQAQSDQSGDLSAGEIVVTANKREQRLNDVGLTVAVISGQSLKNQQINSLSDLANTIPSLSFTNSANGTPVFTLRGIGFYETSLGAYPTVSSYIDEVALPFPVLSSHAAFDLERVEVLKGPQGTLFGQNATGGAINYIAAKPTTSFHAGADLSYGRFNQVIGEGYISGPLAEGVQARLSGRFEIADGWQQSNSRPNDRNGKVRNYMGRLQVALQPTDTISLLLNVNGWKDKGETQAPQFIGLLPQQALLDPDVANATFSPEKPRASDWTPGSTFKDNRLWQASLRADVDLTESIKLTSITAYVDYRQNQADEGDGLPAVSLDLPSDRGRIKSFSQELRFSNGGSDPLRWVVGANYERSSVWQGIQLAYPDSSAHETYGAFLGYPISGAYYTSNQEYRNYAFFGNVEYDIIPDVTLKGGVRYTNAKDTANICSIDNSGLPNDIGGFFFNVLLGGSLGPYAGQCFPLNNTGTTIGGVAPGAPGAYVNTLHQDNVSWKAGVDWKPRPGILVYTNVAKGYKAGSFPTLSASTFSQYTPVSQESVMSYEGGIKASLLDRALQVNLAGFYYDYRDKQLRSKVEVPVFGILDVLQNIPKSTVSGFEIELNMVPTKGFTVNTAFTYLHAKIDQFTGINAAGVQANFAGTRVPYTPKYQLGTNLDYAFPVADGFDAFVGGTVNMRSDTVAVVGGDINPPTASPQGRSLLGIVDYVTLDLRIGLKADGDRWRVSVWGKNVTNSYYWNNVVAAYDTIGRYAAMPATYGISAGYKF